MKEKEPAFRYERLSSTDQEESGFSIPAQIKFLQNYAKKKGFEVVEIFAESITAKEAGRKEFERMLKVIKRQKKACHLLCEKNDRLLRNEDDAATIKNIFTKTNCSVHLLKDNMILNKHSTPHEIFIFMMFSAVSSLYPRNLSNEVTKGMNEAAEEGFFPGKAPTGYMNHRTSKKKSQIIIDKEKAAFVIKAFELYSTGCFTFNSLAKKLAGDGFMIGKRNCTKKTIEKILHNPFYMGEFEYKGKRYFDAKHTPIITKELYYSVQKIIQQRTAPHLTKHEFLYSGMIKCPCGCFLVGDIKKQKYIYYRCTGNKAEKCPRKLLKEEYVNEMVEEMLKKLYCPPEDAEAILAKLKEMLQGKENYEQESLEALQKKISILKSRLNKLYIDKLDETISEEFYFEKKNEWQIELDEARIQFDYLSNESDEIMQRAAAVLTLCKNAYSAYLAGDIQQKRTLLKLITSHFLWDGENLTISIKNTLKPMFKGVFFQNGGLSGAKLTLFAQELLAECKNSNNLIFFETVQNYLAA